MFQPLLQLETLTRFPDDKAMQAVGTLIDLSVDMGRDDGIQKALAWCDELEQRPLPGANTAILDYFRANAWHGRQLLAHRDAEAAWSWDQPEVVEQISFLRRAVRRPEFDELGSVRQPQILTNLGNQLNSLGRFVEALPMWARALAAAPQFGMALGNRGLALSDYAHALYDTGHRQVFLLFAHRSLTDALSDAADYAGYSEREAKEAFAQRRAAIDTVIDIAKAEQMPSLDEYSLGDTDEERDYRRWVLGHGLFLNPLNDLGPHAIAATDVFGLPSFSTDIFEPPTLIGLFNQMKQEYTSARWMLYEGLRADSPHFADRDVLLHNTLDYPSYSLAVEKVKAAYRISYSLFDKIAFFLNDYEKLDVNPKQIYFRSIWYVNQDARRGAIRPEFLGSRNWPQRGLFWLAKDLFDPEMQSTAEPDAQELYIIRNCLEHTYLKVHEMLVPAPATSSSEDLWHDRLAHSVQRDDFCRKTLRVMRLARTAMIYLSLGMHDTERRRKRRDPSLAVLMHPGTWDDDWKR